jgi:thiosulfate reductase cytochrome b subunit
VDWTVLTPAAEPRLVYRGTGETAGQIAGFTPVVVARQAEAGSQLAPYNLVTAWYWQYDAAGQAQPVPLADLRSVYFTASGDYAPEVVAALDADRDGRLSEAELALDHQDKVDFVAQRLATLGLAAPRIASEVWPYALHHGVATDEWAISDCRACHTDQSRLAQPMTLASINPGGGLPTFAGDGEVAPSDGLSISGGLLRFAPATGADGRYVLGHDRAAWADWLGAAAFAGVLLAVAGHGGLRVLAALRAPRPAARARRVYMYAVYERFWHWLQTFSIVLLLFTGLIIHRPDLFALFSFRHIVLVHNVLAALLVINAALSLFYHLASGEIRQYLPRPYGFFDQAITQAKFYLRGIFRGEPHPFEKTPARKLNPLQQATYIAILNVLLPLQVLTGALMWGAQRWPDLAARLGGLGVLGPAHSLVAWLFGAFVVAHVYLTTTGRAPLAGLDAMINGWEDVDLAGHAASQEVLPHVYPDGHVATPEPATAPAPESAAV